MQNIQVQIDINQYALLTRPWPVVAGLLPG